MSSIDPQTLLAWAHSHTRESRAALAETITDLFADGTGHLSDRERALMGDILHKIVVELETAVRRTLSEKLADFPEAPRDLIRFLANDAVEVAYPVLTRSRVLQDEDLIEIIRNRTLEHQLAVARRFALSEAISGALVSTRNVNVIEALLRNDNARIAQSTLAYLVEESKRIDSFHEPLVRRRDLGPDLARRLFLWVSAALRNHLVRRFEFDEATVDALLEAAALESFATPEGAPDASGTERLADALAEEDLLDTETLVNALAIGEVSLFVAMFARTTVLRERVVQRLLFAPGGEELAIACKAAGLDRETLETLFTLSRSARPQTGAPRPEDVRKAGDAFDRIPRADAERVLARWRLDPDFAAAISELEAADGGHG